MPDKIKDNRAKSILTDAAASFIAIETNGFSLITVTSVNITNHGKIADILVTVLPDKESESAINFLKRKRGIFRDYLKAKTKLSRIPFVDFNLDLGEKNRQRIDELTIRKD